MLAVMHLKPCLQLNLYPNLQLRLNKGILRLRQDNEWKASSVGACKKCLFLGLER